MQVKRILVCILLLAMTVSLMPVVTPQVNAGNEDLYAAVDRQVQAYAKSINQNDAASTAATALLTNAAFLGKDLSMDVSNAMTAMLLNSFVFQQALTNAVTSTADTMDKLNETALYHAGYLTWYVETASYNGFCQTKPTREALDRLYTVDDSRDHYGSRRELVKYYNENDRMLVMIAGSANFSLAMERVAMDADTVTYEVDLLIYDQFDYNADYETSSDMGYNRDFEKILSMFGSLSLRAFYWECSGSFRVTVPYACDHQSGAYRWELDQNTQQLICDSSGAYLSNPGTKYLKDAEAGADAYYFELKDPIVLKHDKPWVLYYDIRGSLTFYISPMGFTVLKLPSIHQYRTVATLFHSFIKYSVPPEKPGEKPDYVSARHAYGIDYREHNVYTSGHTMRYYLENVPAEDGSNTVYLSIYDLDKDQLVYGPAVMDEYHYADKSGNALIHMESGNPYFNGRDFLFNYWGTRANSLNTKFLSGAVFENGIEGQNTDSFEETAVAATCNSEGYILHTCVKCGYSYKTDFTEKLSHDYAAKVVAPTCSAEGYTQYTCTMCGDTYRTDTTEKLPHTCTAYTSNNDATCAHDGTKTGQCTVCGERVTVTDEGTALPHTWTDATCEKAKTCKFCGATEGEPLGHDLKYYNAKAPICENVGWDAYEKCQRCSYSTFARLPALGHEYHNGVCTRCGDWDGTIVPGEVTGDGKIDMADAYRIILHLSGKLTLNEAEQAAADVNGDGTVDFIDIYRIILYYREVTKQ